MQLWIEVHHQPGDDPESEADVTAFDMDRKNGLKELGKVLEKRLADAQEADEVIATITVQSVEE